MFTLETIFDDYFVVFLNLSEILNISLASMRFNDIVRSLPLEISLTKLKKLVRNTPCLFTDVTKCLEYDGYVFGVKSAALSRRFIAAKFSLDLNFDCRITDDAICKLRNLTCLSINYNDKITDCGIEELSNLKTISFVGNKNITDNSLIN
jgi:hypothetical protein